MTINLDVFGALMKGAVFNKENGDLLLQYIGIASCMRKPSSWRIEHTHSISEEA